MTELYADHPLHDVDDEHGSSRSGKEQDCMSVLIRIEYRYSADVDTEDDDGHSSSRSCKEKD